MKKKHKRKGFQKYIGESKSQDQDSQGSVKRHWTRSRKSSVVPECHTGTVTVFIDPLSGLPIKAGGRLRNVKATRRDLLIDVGCEFTPLFTCKNVKSAELLEKWDVSQIKIDWSDGAVPDNLHIGFWVDLVKVIRDTGKPVVIACLGGHGRTGTALSILAHLMRASRGLDPVAFIRKHYCKNAVETWEQLDYIAEITGIEVKVYPSNTHFGSSLVDWDEKELEKEHEFWEAYYRTPTNANGTGGWNDDSTES